MDLILQSLVNGLIQGGFYSLFAIGLVLIFGVMRVVNFAHGELVMAGAFTIWVIHAQLGIGYIPSIIAAIVLVTVIGLLMERMLFRPTRADPLAGLICSIGVLFILQVCATLVGGDGPSKQVPPPYHGTLVLFDLIRIPYQRLFSLGISAAALGTLWYFLTRTKFGWALRAVAMDLCLSHQVAIGAEADGRANFSHARECRSVNPRHVVFLGHPRIAGSKQFDGWITSKA